MKNILPNQAPEKCPQVEFTNSLDSWWASGSSYMPNELMTVMNVELGIPKMSSFQPNEAIADEGFWRSYLVDNASKLENQTFRVALVSAWKGRIKFTTTNEPGDPNRPAWFLVSVNFIRYRKVGYLGKSTETPRQIRSWLATDGDSWYRICQPHNKKRRGGRHFIPCDIKLHVSVKAVLEAVIKSAVGSDV